MSACSISAPIPTSSPAHTLGSTATSAPTSLASSALVPLAYWFGHTHLRGREALAQRLIRNLAESVEIRLSSDEAGMLLSPPRHDLIYSNRSARASGVFIDTPSSFAVAGADHKYTLVQACVEAFRGNFNFIYT
jgi:polyribonucleotide 5'-hydroxyl-kinase